jgi:hypothetical protein
MRVVVVSIDAWGQGRGQPSIAGGAELEFFNPARRGERGRDRLAARAARVGRLAEPPGRMADRGLRPGRRLGHLAEILTGRT